MKNVDINKLVEWLGPEGAVAGLERSPYTVSDLYNLAVGTGASVHGKMRRTDLINELVNRKISQIKKPLEELMLMKHQELKAYFEENRVSATELLKLLSEVGITPGSEARKHLADFAAREISELGMYKRVAEGPRKK